MIEIKGHLETILRKMCWFVDIKFEDVDFKSPDWFHSKTWDEIDQYLFIQWLRIYLRANEDAQLELHGKKLNKVSDIKKLSEQFTNNYGWRVNPESVDKFRGQLK